MMVRNESRVLDPIPTTIDAALAKVATTIRRRALDLASSPDGMNLDVDLLSLGVRSRISLGA